MIEDIQTKEISAFEPDWSREKLQRWWNPQRQLLKSIREYQKWQKQGGIIGEIMSRFKLMH
jgi:serine O-acetyltransferase